ncbi:MAG: NAD(P)/FAD-dependent oxidoreductase [Syntrophomonadaceae bacterium]|nr:NAD(P)/FAD-dependent oxidoreductase [Syntrophomonadaceae bacterium]
MGRIVIIGNGAAGNCAATAIRKHRPDLELLMISHESLPAYSACALPDFLAGWVERNRLFIREERDYARLAIDTRFGQEVVALDTAGRKVVLERERIPYDRLILATGSRAIIPPVEGSHLPGNFVVKSVLDAEAILRHGPNNVVVVGSGNIGVEVAEALQVRGCRVTLIEMMEHILPRAFDAEPAGRIAGLLARQGIEILTGQKVLKVGGAEKVASVYTEDGEMPCDTVVWAAGVKQNVEIARAAGINIGRLGGIMVNSFMETNIDRIYACGDCIESTDILTGRQTLSLLWPNAKRQGEVAGLNCIGRQVKYEGSLNVVVEELYGTIVVAIGLTSRDLAGENLGVLEEEGEDWYYRALVVDDRIMGFQSVGITSGIGVVTALMKKRTPVSEIRRIMADPVLARKVWWWGRIGHFGVLENQVD